MKQQLVLLESSSKGYSWRVDPSSEDIYVDGEALRLILWCTGVYIDPDRTTVELSKQLVLSQMLKSCSQNLKILQSRQTELQQMLKEL